MICRLHAYLVDLQLICTLQLTATQGPPTAKKHCKTRANRCNSLPIQSFEKKLKKRRWFAIQMACSTWSASWWDGKRIFFESWMLFCCNWFVRFRKLLALCCFTCAKMRAKNLIKINQNSVKNEPKINHKSTPNLSKIRQKSIPNRYTSETHDCSCFFDDLDWF